MFEHPTTISPSRISSFLSCPMKFRFESVEMFGSKPGLAALRGSCVHLALETFFIDQFFRKSELERHANAALDTFLVDPDFLALNLAEKDVEKFRTDVFKLCFNYLAMENPSEVRVKGVELRLEVELDGWTLRGIIDRLDEPEDGVLEVVDYKTGRPPSNNYVQKSSLGVNLYALMCERTFGVLPRELKLMYVRDKVTVSAQPNTQSMKALRMKVSAVQEAVFRACDSGKFHAKPSPLCNYCEFKPFCPAFGGVPEAAETVFERRLP